MPDKGLGAINEHNAALAAPPGEEAAKPAFRVGQDATGANYEQFAPAPPVEAGLEGQAADIAERWIRIRIQRDAPQEMIDSLKDFIVERFRTRDRELVKKLEELAVEWDGPFSDWTQRHLEHAEPSEEICARELRAVLAARNEGATK